MTIKIQPSQAHQQVVPPEYSIAYKTARIVRSGEVTRIISEYPVGARTVIPGNADDRSENGTEFTYEIGTPITSPFHSTPGICCWGRNTYAPTWPFDQYGEPTSGSACLVVFIPPGTKTIITKHDKDQDCWWEYRSPMIQAEQIIPLGILTKQGLIINLEQARQDSKTGCLHAVPLPKKVNPQATRVWDVTPGTQYVNQSGGVYTLICQESYHRALLNNRTGYCLRENATRLPDGLKNNKITTRKGFFQQVKKSEWTTEERFICDLFGSGHSSGDPERFTLKSTDEE